MNNSSIELEAPMKSAFCTSTYVNGHKKKRPSNIKSRQITMLKNMQITTAKTQFSKCPITQKHDVSENLAPIACIYIYIYAYILTLHMAIHLTFYLTYILTGNLAFYPKFYLRFHLTFYLTFDLA